MSRWMIVLCAVTMAGCAGTQSAKPQAASPGGGPSAPFIEKIDLFVGGQNGYAMHQIPGVAVTEKGTVLAWCEARKKGGDWDDIRILLRRSTDDGRTFSEPKIIAHVDGPIRKNPMCLHIKSVVPTDITYNNPVLIPDRDGSIHMLFCIEYERCFYQRSTDDGVTWSKPVEITKTFEAFRPKYDWKVIATGPDHGIQLKNGRLVVPVWISTGTGGNAHRPSVTATIYSDDRGKTWHAGDIAAPDTAEWVFPNETVAVELADGRVMLNVRSESKVNRRLTTISPDGATHWSTPKFDQALNEPICMGSVVRVSKTSSGGDRNRIMFSNPDNLERADGKAKPGEKRDRKNISIKLSYDEANTWAVNKVLEPGPSMYSDVSVTKKGTLLCFYGRGSGLSSAGDKLTMARFNLEWLTDGKDWYGAPGSVSAKPQAAKPMLEKTDLFTGGVGDYLLYRIPGIVVTTKGTVLAHTEARKSGAGDWVPIDILMRRSTDGGRTFSPPVKVSEVPGPHKKNPVALEKKLALPNDLTYNNAVCFVDRQTGQVIMLFCVDYWRCFRITSSDDGVTWSKPVEITKTFEAFKPEYPWRVLATGPAHGIQLTSGRLVVPVWLSTASGGHGHRPSVTATIYSDDHGKTWKRGAIAVPDTPDWVYPNETVIVELADGSVMLNVRSESKTHRRLVTVSPDGAKDWSTPRFDDALVEPICMASIVRYSGGQMGGASGPSRILFANPQNLERADGKAAPGTARDRKNLSVKLTYDDGKTWPVNKTLDAGYSAYSDMAVLPDGTVLCLYERGDAADAAVKKPTSYKYLTLARFNLAWLTDGKDNGAK